MTVEAGRGLFGAYAATPLNDVSVPPFPGHEADDDEDTPSLDVQIDYERAAHEWAPIAAGTPTADVPVRFVDGSMMSRAGGCITVDFRRRPLIVAAVSAAALEMDGRTLRRAPNPRIIKALCVNSNAMDPDVLEEAKRSLWGIHVILKTSTAQAAQLDFDSMRRSTRSIALELMGEAERDVMLDAIETPTLIDGLLERRLAAQRHDVPVIGLVKRQMATYLPGSLQEVQYNLQPSQRTPAFVLDTPQHVRIVNFYLRLSSEVGISPSYGVVRVTAPLAYVESQHADDVPGYLSGLAAYIYRLRHRDLAYGRSGISVEPIVRVEDHLHALLPNLDALIPKLHRLMPGRNAA